MTFFLDWLFEALRFLFLYTGLVVWVGIVLWMLDFRGQRRAWLHAVNRHRQEKAARAHATAHRAEAAPFSGRLTRLHGERCRCMLCLLEGKGGRDA